MNTAIRVIRDEHAALVAVLRSISLLLSESRRRDVLPDLAPLRAMLFYIDAFPEKVHHIKESELLFPMLRKHTAEADTVLDRLDRDHAVSEAAVRDLQHQLLGVEMMSEGPDFADRVSRFEMAAQAYVKGYLEHIRIEEVSVLPIAERVLTAEDWVELDAAFLANRDPLTQPNDEYRPLFQRILMTLPAPLGLGSAMAAFHVSYPRHVAA